MITKQNAAELARRSAIARKQNRIDLLKAASALDLIREEHRKSIAEAEQSPEHVKLSLLRTREAVGELFGRLKDEISADELDAGKVDKLTSAVARMAELERVLSMRPAPAPLRSKPSKSRSDSATPLDPVATAGTDA